MRFHNLCAELALKLTEVRSGKWHGESYPGKVRCTAADTVPSPPLLTALTDSDTESKCIGFQYTKKTFDLSEYSCRKHVSRRKKSSIKK